MSHNKNTQQNHNINVSDKSFETVAKFKWHENYTHNKIKMKDTELSGSSHSLNLISSYSYYSSQMSEPYHILRGFICYLYIMVLSCTLEPDETWT
jgi:hypothetical protein